MSLFGHKNSSFGQTNSAQDAKLNSIRYQTAQAGSVIPIVYGTMRVSPNLIAYADFQVHDAPSGSGKKGGGAKGGKGGGGGGKKGGGSSTASKAKTFSADVDFGICQGPVTIHPTSAVYAGTVVTTFSASPWNFYGGRDGQAADPVFLTQGDTVGYSGTCHITQTPMNFGGSPAIENVSFEISGFFATTGDFDPALGVGDANPGLVIADALTNLRYGAGFPAANLDDLAPGGGKNTYGDYCLAAELSISMEMDGQSQAQQWLSGLADLTNTAIVWSNKLLKFIPYGDETLTNGAGSWTPNLVPQYDLDDDDFLPWTARQDGSGPSEGDDDPVIITRSNPADAINWLTVEYLDRKNQYNPTILPVFDQGAIDLYGLRTGANLQGHAFAQPRSATVAAQLRLQRLQYIRNTYKFKLGWQFCLLEPMDIVLITDRYIGISKYPVRITSIEEDATNGDLTFEAEQIENGPPAPPKVVPPPAPPAALSLDGSAVNFNNLVSHTVTSSTFRMSTTMPNNVIVLHIVINAEGGPGQDQFPPSVTSVDGGGLAWARRARASGQGANGTTGDPGNSFVDSEVWWAVASLPLAAVPITVHSSSDLAFLNVIAFAFNGVNLSAPWDPDPSLPAIASHPNGPAAQPGVSGVSTSGPGIILWFFDEFSVFGALGGPAGFTALAGGTSGSGGGFDPVQTDMTVFNMMAPAALSSATLNEEPGLLGVTGPLPSWFVIADALRSAS